MFSSPISVLWIWSDCSIVGATAPTVEICALDSASTQPNSTTTRVRAGPPTNCTTWPRISPQNQSTPATEAEAARRVVLIESIYPDTFAREPGNPSACARVAAAARPRRRSAGALRELIDVDRVLRRGDRERALYCENVTLPALGAARLAHLHRIRLAGRRDVHRAALAGVVDRDHVLTVDASTSSPSSASRDP